jgi:hypothetical protein
VASDIIAQKYFRKAGVPAAAEEGEGTGRSRFPGCGATVADEKALAGDARRPALRPETIRRRSSTAWPAPGPIGAGRAAISTAKRMRGLPRRDALHAGHARWRRRTLPQWFNTGLHWAYGIDGPSQGHLRGLQDRQADQIEQRLRAPAAACLLHPVGGRRSGQRRRHHGPVGARGAPVQIRLRHRLQLLHSCAAKARSCRAAASPPA